ncbi:flagellar basal body P-ring biosynthesis protein FlgA [Kordiimonas sediminis]|uniref:Flagellar basal body P-ring biosynthesis protein FlgA n=1 Tax=Kordiimonas sediminis TaxID=1735581 RepID=A0A919AYW8_9PROT|nr:flagellar basal body P-ring formation chaperone FlgA [Kordiimonas sediminis]GHF29390.1 flagellar basal body P-ring biosynthesis protein FlgA [Kordiimonas sediminis]
MTTTTPKTRMVKSLLASLCLISGGMDGTAFAAVLKNQIEVTQDTVRLSDIFDGEDITQDIVIMAAPAPGQDTQISAYELESLALKNGVNWERPSLLKKVRIARAGNRLSQNTLQDMVEDAAHANGLYDKLNVRLFGSQKDLFLPVDLNPASLAFEEFTLSPNKDRFTAILHVPTSAGAYDRITLTGALEQIRQIPVLASGIMPGHVISEADILWESFPIRRLTRNTVQSMDELIGMTLRRPIRSGNMIRTTDVQRPELVKKGSAVQVILSQGSMQLSSVGKALESGGKGEMIRIMNLSSKKTIEARIIAADRVEIVTTNIFAMN